MGARLLVATSCTYSPSRLRKSKKNYCMRSINAIFVQLCIYNLDKRLLLITPLHHVDKLSKRFLDLIMLLMNQFLIARIKHFVPKKNNNGNKKKEFLFEFWFTMTLNYEQQWHLWSVRDIVEVDLSVKAKVT